MSTLTLQARPAQATGLRRYWRHGAGVMVYRGILKALRLSRLNRWIEIWGHQYIAIHPWHLRVPSRAPRGMTVEEIQADQCGDLLTLRPQAGDEFRRRFDAGQRCFGAYLQSRCVAFMWAVEGPGVLPTSFHSHWSIPPRIVWLFDLYSDPGVLGAMSYLHSCVRRCLSDGRPHWLAGQVDYDNHRSLQGHTSLGYQVLGRIWSMRLGPMALHLLQRRHGRLPSLRFGTADLHLLYFHDGLPFQNPEDGGPASPEATTTEPHLSTSPRPAPPQTENSVLNQDRLWIQCTCGESLEMEGDSYICPRCGHELGYRREGVHILGRPIPYWGEVPQATMQHLLGEMQAGNWREAVKRLVPAPLHEYILSPYRAAFEDVIDFPPGARVLEVGAGLGGIATELARKYRVVALEGVWERTRFMALRAAQDGLNHFLAINGNINSIPFAPEQFDVIVVNGVLEWAAMADLQGNPTDVQILFLQRLRRLLKPGGMIYLAIENRIGWNELRGTADHSGLPYTSLMPRFLARWVCARSRRYRSVFNVGYRTYTYSFFGYRRLFRRAGLEIRQTFISPYGYNLPVKMIPLQQAAIRFASRMERPTVALRSRLRHVLVRMLGQEWFWRLTGGDFAFVLTRPSGGDHA